MQEREILFRGKTYDGKWEQGDLRHGGYVHNDSETYIMRADYAFHNIPVDPKTVGQYTGLTDKNGVKIFEGDIVSFCDCTSTENGYSEQYCTGVVAWDSDTLSFQVTNRLSAESYEVLVECTVIGNIHDNPELFEVK